MDPTSAPTTTRTDSRRFPRPTTGRWSRLIPAAAVLAGVLALGACNAGADATTDAVVSARSGDAAGPDEAAAATSASSRNARLTAEVTVRSEPDESAATVTTLGAQTALGSPTTLLVVDERDGWLQVSLPTRPNGSSGWIRSDAAEVRTNPLAITIDRDRKQLTLTRDGQVEVEAPIADGTEANPTPAGDFYVTDIVATGNEADPYGPFALGLSGHSETLTEFNGGDGQLGLHGTNDPAAIGTSVSHGCVRVTNDIITDLADTVSLGTPVTII